MNLPQLASEYLAAHLGLSARHRADVQMIANRIHRELRLVNGTMPTQVQLIGWLQRLLDQGRSPHSVNHYVRVLNALFAWGANWGLCQPMKLSKVKAPPPIPQAWTVEEVSRLVQAASQLSGCVGRWPAKDWWPALILTLYWTGARIGSVLAARPSDLDLKTGLLWLTKTKNVRPKPERLHPQAIETIQKIYDPQADRLFVWPWGSQWFYRQFRRLQEQSGVSIRRGAAFHRFRDTCLTYCWAVDPAIAQRQADHSSAEITKRHYVDPRIAGLSAPQAADILPMPKISPPEKQLWLLR